MLVAAITLAAILAVARAQLPGGLCSVSNETCQLEGSNLVELVPGVATVDQGGNSK